MSAAVSPDFARSLRRLEHVVAFALWAWVCVTTARALSRAWNFTTDDAYITLRYARHLADGRGIVWNIGEPPLEGFSNFSFVLLGAGAMKIGADPILVVKWAGALGLFGALAASYVLCRRWVGHAAAAIPAAFLTGYKGTLTWSVSGLETGFYLAAALAAVAFTAVAMEEGGRRRTAAIAGGLALLAALTRPEGVVIACCCAGALFVGRGRRVTMSFLAAFALPYVLYSVFRLWYFGHALPNGVRCKMAMGEDPWQLDGSFCQLAWPVAVVAAAVLPKRLDARHVLLWVLVIAHLVIFHGVDPVLGGDNRYFLLPYTLLLVLAVANACRILEWMARGRAAMAQAIAAVAMALAISGSRAAAADSAQAWGTFYWFRMGNRAALGRSLRDMLSPGASYVIGDAGLVGYLAPQRLLDAYCLNSAEMTSPAIAKRTPAFVDWVLASRPEAIVVHAMKDDPAAVPDYYGFYPALIARPEFHAAYELVGRFGNPGDLWYFVYRRARPT